MAMLAKPYSLAVRAVIRNEHGHCLLLRRANTCKRFVGRWELPGGKMDPGETFDAALRREVTEETGLSVEVLGVAGAFGFEMEKVRVATLCMEVAIIGGTFTLSEEHDEHAWIPMTQLLEYDLTDGWSDLARSWAARG